jgi:hypothetical protein
MNLAKRSHEICRNRLSKRVIILTLAIIAMAIGQEAAAQHNHRGGKKCVAVKRATVKHNHHKHVHHHKHGHRWVAGHYGHRHGIRVWIPGLYIKL